jgi:protocatechuate 3,4-dioxygenase beta subunit
VTVVYGGDGTYAGSNVTGWLYINLMNTTTIILNADGGNPLDQINITGIVLDENNNPVTSGFVTVNIRNDTFSIDLNATLNSTGGFSVSISTLTGLGIYNVTATYNGYPSVYNGSVRNTTFFIGHVTTYINVNNANVDATQSVTITGSLTHTASSRPLINGTVSVTIIGPNGYMETFNVTVIDGNFSFNRTMYVSGPYNIVVRFDGNIIFASSTGQGQLDVNLINTTTILGNVEFRATFSSNLTANVTDYYGNPVVGAHVEFWVDGTNVGNNTTDANGIAIYSYTPLVEGDVVVEARYSGSTSIHGNSTYRGSMDVMPAVVTMMGTRIVFDPVTTKPFINTTIWFTLLDEFGDPIGNVNVTIIINGTDYNVTTNPNGRAFITFTPNIAINVPISAFFNGTERYQLAIGDGTLIVEKILTSSLIGNHIITTIHNTDFSVTLIDEYGKALPSRLVEIFFDGVSIGTFETDVNGRVFINHNPLPKGLYNITVVYEGDVNYARSVSNGTLEVRLVRTTLKLSVFPYPDFSAIFLAKLLDEWGRPIANKIIIFELDGVVIGTGVTDSNGIAFIKYLELSSGMYNPVVYFIEDNIYEGSVDGTIFSIKSVSSTTNLVVYNAKAKVDKKVVLSAKLTDSNGNPLKDCPIDFYVDGVFIGTAITDVNGMAYINYTSNTSGQFIIKGVFNPLGIYSAANGTGLLTVGGNNSESENNNTAPGPNDPDTPGKGESDRDVGMLNTGNPIATLALFLLSLLFVGFKRKQKN